MITVIADFEKRSAEVEAYFQFIKKIIEQDAVLLLPRNRTKKHFVLNDELHKTLKSNLILMLYNLMESAITLSLSEIYESISLKKPKFNELTDEIRTLWLKTKYQNFSKNMSSSAILAVINNIANDVIEMEFDKRRSVISGNIDARKIKEFAAMFGFRSKVHYSLGDGSHLLRIKSERNHLAHGEKSFSECGRLFSIYDLEKMKNQVIKYLRSIIKNIQHFLHSEGYKV